MKHILCCYITYAPIVNKKIVYSHAHTNLQISYPLLGFLKLEKYEFQKYVLWRLFALSNIYFILFFEK